ncbi:MAG TPA: hypothetical protein P5058_05300 [Eubacteriales bacterium]|nr:hypothetical protein [Eubacteriales bacterium]
MRSLGILIKSSPSLLWPVAAAFALAIYGVISAIILFAKKRELYLRRASFVFFSILISFSPIRLINFLPYFSMAFSYYFVYAASRAHYILLCVLFEYILIYFSDWRRHDAERFLKAAEAKSVKPKEIKRAVKPLTVQAFFAAPSFNLLQ